MATCNSLLDCTEKHIYLFTKSNYDIIECPICGYCYAKISDKELHIAKTYSDSYFFDGKDGYPNYLEEETTNPHFIGYEKISSTGRMAIQKRVDTSLPSRKWSFRQLGKKYPLRNCGVFAGKAIIFDLY